MNNLYLIIAILFSFNSISADRNIYLPRKIYMGIEGGLSALEMALPNDEIQTGSDVDFSLFEPNYSPNLGLFVGVEIWDRYFISPFIEANFNYARAHETDHKDEDALEKGANSNLTSVRYSIVHMDATGEVGANLNLLLKNFVISPFLSAEFGLAWRQDKTRYTKSGTSFSRISKVKFTNTKLNVGVRIVNLSNYFSLIKLGYSNLTTSSQKNNYDVNGSGSESSFEHYEQDNQTGAKSYFSLTLGGGLYF